MDESISEYERERHAKLQKLRDLGVDPYGQRTEGIDPLAKIKSSYSVEMGHDGGPVVKGAGRIMLKRDMGKLSFITLRDDSGDLQVGLDKKRLDEKAWEVRNLLDLGDQIIVEGPLGTTNKGETTIWATALSMASKAMLPPPAKWEGLGDVELRYRQRYVDLWANPEVMRMMKLRIRVMEEIRSFLKGRGFLEVETPMMQTIHGGAAAKPFKTHHNALDIELNMRIAPELYLKRLLVGGFTKIFELNRNFRNEGISPRHNPEFTMLEAYEAYGSWETMAELMESMICQIAQNVLGTLHIKHPNGRHINLEGNTSKSLGQRWRRVTMRALVADWTTTNLGHEWKFQKEDIRFESPVATAALIRKTTREEYDRIGDRQSPHLADYTKLNYGDEYAIDLRRVCQGLASKNEIPSEIGRPAWALTAQAAWNYLGTLSPAEQLAEFYEKLVEPTLTDPTFVTQVPSVIIPLARENKEDPFFADVYELAINGVEISPGYTELNDPEVQAKHFSHQVGDKDEQQKTDEDFLAALKYGMPPAGGLGMGVDRLLMMLTGAESIRDVILFPLMKPHG